MKLYYSPNACSLGIHLLLQEIGQPYGLQRVDLQAKEQYSADFIAINPKSKLPLLEPEDGKFISEFSAIAFYLARLNPQAGLLPPGVEAEIKAIELLDYLIATVHMRGFTRIFRPELFAPSPRDKQSVQDAGREVVVRGFELIELALSGKNYILGTFSIVDAALFFLEYWAETRAGIALPANAAAHLRRLRMRPAVAHVLAAEGLA